MKLVDTKNGKVLVMSFVDAEHSGMKLDELENEADIVGLDLPKEKPIALLIQVEGGFAIWEHSIAKMSKEEQDKFWAEQKEKDEVFKRLLEAL